MTDKKPETGKPDADKGKTAASRTEAAAAGAASAGAVAKSGAGTPPNAPAGVARNSAPKPASGERDLVPFLYLAGFIILSAAVIWLWQNPPEPPPSNETADIEVLRQEVKTLTERVAHLEQRPAPAPPQMPDLSALTAKVNALEARKPPAAVDLGPLEAAIAALEQRPAVPPGLAQRVDTLAASQDTLASHLQTAQTTIETHQDAIEKQVATLSKDAADAAAVAQRSARIARIQSAQAALESGAKLGARPGAPAALSRYADAPPPTEASLRVAFGPAAAAALAASRPATVNQSFLDRAWMQAQDLVTVRQGDHVIIGDPAAGLIARARAALDAGDIAGAVAAVNGLSGDAAVAMAGWKAQAQGLLDARKALADMAAHA